MEIPIQVACRIGPTGCSNEPNFIQSIPATSILLPSDDVRHESDPIATGIDGSHTYPGLPIHLPKDCTQDYVYHQTVYPMLAIFLEGFDVSFVTYGQQGTGKTYTMLGPGFDCVFSERDHGIMQRCVRDIFVKMGQQRERSYVINVGWVEIVVDEIHDLLDVGTVQCLSIGDVFHWLKIGLHNRTADNHYGHSLFTLTLEQQWINAEGLIQHRLSTASFCDLCATERLIMNSIEQHISVPKDLGLQALERIVHALTDPNCLMVDYNQTTLTTLLKDSFGGRAQTLFILCVSPFEDHFTETQHNLQFAFKVQCIRNFVVLNTFSDNNTVAHVPNETAEQPDTFGLQFAASQWLKLVSNAEGLFTKLITSKSLNEQDRERVEEWMFLKQECEECLSSGEINMANQRHLGPIQEEADEQEETSDQETSCLANTDPDSDSESQHPDLNEKIASLMEDFQDKTDLLVRENYDEFVRSHPKAMLDSNDSFRKIQEPIRGNDDSRSPSPNYERRQSPVRCDRRKSYQPDGLSVSSMQLAMLNRVASGVASRNDNCSDKFLSKAANVFVDPIAKRNPLEVIQKKISKINAEMEAHQRLIKELKNTIALKKKLITDLHKTSEASATAKQRLDKQKLKRQAEKDKCEKNLLKAKIVGGDKTNIDRLEVKKTELEQKLKNLNKTIGLTDESGHNIKQHKKSLKMSQKQLEELDDTMKRNKKLKDSLENELRNEKSKIHKDRDVGAVENNTVASKTLKDVNARISHMEIVLKEKSIHLQQFDDSKDGEALRQEIRHLRRIRDQVLKDKRSLVQKLKKEKTLSQFEERKLLEYEESVEAIDHIVEYKNELICGRKSADADDILQMEKGQQMLVDKWNNLPAEEMRTLLYKYFQKAIDLRDSTGKLEQQLMSLERERDAWECRERALNNAIRQARLEGESHAVLLQQQQEAKMALMLRHLADETSTSSSMTDRYVGHHQHQHQHRSNYRGNPDDSGAGCGYGLDIYKPSIHHKQMIKSKAPNMDLYPISDGRSRYKYRPLDKMNEKNREGKNNFFANIFARYNGGFGVDRRKVQDSSMSIPEQNLKQLQASQEPMTKVTREKNKIIIQQDGKHSGHRH